MIQQNIGAKTAMIQKKNSAETDMYQQQRHAALESEVGAKLTFCD